MSYEIDYPWRRNPRLIKLNCWHGLSEDALAAALDHITDLYEQSTLPMHIVIDFQETPDLPNTLPEVFLESPMLYHPNQGICILLNPDGLIRFLGQVLAQQIDLHLEFCEDEATAWEFFNQRGLC